MTQDTGPHTIPRINPAGPASVPPPVPAGNGGTAAREEVARPDAFARFGEDFQPQEDTATLLRTVESLLKRPGRVAYEVVRGRQVRAMVILAAILVACMLGYGLIMGAFSGGHQLWAVPVKVAAGMLLSAVICLPSLYIFTCLAGGDQSPAEVTGLLLASLALSAVLLAGFAPVTWLFSQSTNAASFMGGMHLVFWITGTVFGLRLLHTALAFLNGRRMAVLRLWGTIFALVVMQMCTTLRPLIGAYDGARLEGKQFFLAHWGDALKGR
jgi:hypothetical protein